MKTCNTCKHWKLNPRYANYDQICTPTDQDTYKLMAMPFDVRECMHPALVRFERTSEKNGFGVSDGSDYMARFCTGPNFGCVRHEAAL